MAPAPDRERGPPLIADRRSLDVARAKATADAKAKSDAKAKAAAAAKARAAAAAKARAAADAKAKSTMSDAAQRKADADAKARADAAAKARAAARARAAADERARSARAAENAVALAAQRKAAAEEADYLSLMNRLASAPPNRGVPGRRGMDRRFGPRPLAQRPAPGPVFNPLASSVRASPESTATGCEGLSGIALKICMANR